MRLKHYQQVQWEYHQLEPRAKANLKAGSRIPVEVVAIAGAGETQTLTLTLTATPTRLGNRVEARAQHRILGSKLVVTPVMEAVREATRRTAMSGATKEWSAHLGPGATTFMTLLKRTLHGHLKASNPGCQVEGAHCRLRRA